MLFFRLKYSQGGSGMRQSRRQQSVKEKKVDYIHLQMLDNMRESTRARKMICSFLASVQLDFRPKQVRFYTLEYKKTFLLSVSPVEFRVIICSSTSLGSVS